MKKSYKLGVLLHEIFKLVSVARLTGTRLSLQQTLNTGPPASQPKS